MVLIFIYPSYCNKTKCGLSLQAELHQPHTKMPIYNNQPSTSDIYHNSNTLYLKKIQQYQRKRQESYLQKKLQGFKKGDLGAHY